MQALHARGCNTYIETGPRPVLLGMGRQCVPEGATWLASLRPEAEDWSALLPSLAKLYVQGVAVNWEGFDRDFARSRVPLPNYPFERRRYWIDTTVKADPVRAAAPAAVNGLLGSRIALATTDIVYTNRLSADHPAYLRDHVVGGETLMPATALIEMALRAARLSTGAEGAGLAIEDIVFATPLVLRQGELDRDTARRYAWHTRRISHFEPRGRAG